MRVGGFTYVRNGITLDYPFVESIKSVLPIVDDIVVIVGDSNDGTREAIEAINDKKIRIVDSIWDPTALKDGLVFAQQANLGIRHADPGADLLLHIQADEVLHEKDLPHLEMVMKHMYYRKDVDGIVLPFFHFFGDYKHFAPSRRFHQWEVRIIKNNTFIGSYKDSQGFRWFLDTDNPNDKGKKLKCVAARAFVYHYSWAKPPKYQKLKRIEFGNRYGGKTDKLNYEDEVYEEAYKDTYNYREYDYLKKFTGKHPRVMQERVNAQDWPFEYDPQKNNMTFMEKVLMYLDEWFNIQPFVYKNYIKVK